MRGARIIEAGLIGSRLLATGRLLVLIGSFAKIMVNALGLRKLWFSIEGEPPGDRKRTGL